MAKNNQPTFQPQIVGRVPATQGVAKALQFLRTNYLAEVSGIHRVIISQSLTHVVVNGKPLWLNQSHVGKLQQAIRSIGAQLVTTVMTAEPDAASDQPLCYGNDFVEKFSTLRKVLNITALFRDVMGWSEGKMKMHLNHKKEKYYNKFTPDELQEINQAIHTVAMVLCSIELEMEEECNDRSE